MFLLEIMIFFCYRILCVALWLSSYFQKCTATLRAISSTIGDSKAPRGLQTSNYDTDMNLSVDGLCGCQSCNDSAAIIVGDTTTCSQKIMGLITDYRFTEEAACHRISKMEFAPDCAQICDSDLCDGKGTYDQAVENTYCGCDACTDDVWNSMAGDFSCGSRITYLNNSQSKTQAGACHEVAVQYEGVCGHCDSETCNLLDYGTTIATKAPTSPRKTFIPTSAPQQGTTNSALDHSTYKYDKPLRPDYPLYCFPAYQQRTRFTNVWGKYTLEAKEGDTCGPSGNVFSADSVSLNDDKNELKLQFKKVGGRWEAAEVRVLLPEGEMPFNYGNYSFSIKSVQIIDTTTGTVTSTTLPVTMILGMFTWDATEDYATHENYNHEVDIEISRWDYNDLADVQFLVQPPGEPQKYRFYSGNIDGTYKQAPQTYSFDWRPGEIDWKSSAGAGRNSFTLKTQDALNAGTPDYIQCMPADVEVRLNVWHLFGNSQPKGMQDTDVLEVVFDDFQFTPNGLHALQDGGTCSKNCQCGADSTCQNNKCTYVAANANPDFRPSPPAVADGTSSSGDAKNNQNHNQVESGDKVSAGNGKNPPADTKYVSTKSTDSRSRGGMKAGVSFLIIGIIIAAAIIFMRSRREKVHQLKIQMFGAATDPTKTVVIDNEKETGKEVSFEMSMKNYD